MERIPKNLFLARRYGRRILAAAFAIGAWAAWGQQPFDDGTYLVGTDILPGLYQAPGGERCYWLRLSGLGGEISDIIASEYKDTRPIVEIKESDRAFKTTRCGTWEPVSGREYIVVPMEVYAHVVASVVLSVISTVGQDSETIDAVLVATGQWSDQMIEEVREQDREFVTMMLAGFEKSVMLFRDDQ